MLIKELAQLQLQKKLISIDRDCHDEELTGVVVSANESFVLLQQFTDNGDYDGYSLFETAQITEVYWGNREHEAIDALIDKSVNLTVPKIKAKSFGEAIIELNERFSNICIYKYHSESNFEIAKIQSYDNDWIKIHSFGPKRSLSRLEKLIQVASISRVEIDSPYQKNIESLHKIDL